MEILVDTREKNALTFQMVDGVSVKSECLSTGDYGFRHKDGSKDEVVFERKSIADLFNSFSGGYDNEKAKIMRAKEAGQKFILAIEGTISEVLQGHEYRKDGEIHRSKKDGLSQIRQLCTLQRKYGIEVMFFDSRKEMAFYIQEYFLAGARLRSQKSVVIKEVGGNATASAQ